MIQVGPSQGFIDDKSIGTFAVSTVGIVAVSVVFRKVFKIHHPLVPLICSIVISIALAVNSGTHTFLGWIIALLNAALLFCASIGANEMGTGVPTGGGEQHGAGPMPLFKSYFNRTD
jgi:hypothetical protein